MALPDFIIIGAMKCGTSTLQSQLSAQTGVFMTKEKEPNFFSDDAIYEKGIEWYQSLFNDAAVDDIKGEASTHYTKLPTYPDCLSRMAADLSAVKLIYLIRNPIERAISHYIHEWSMGVITEDFETAFKSHPEILSYGHYGAQITPYIDTFGIDNIHLVSLEAIKADPQQSLSEIGEFLGVNRPLHWYKDIQRANVSSARIKRFPFHNILIDSSIATILRRKLIPQGFRDKIKSLRQMSKRPEISECAKKHYELEFIKDYERLSLLFPCNRHLNLSYPFVTT